MITLASACPAKAECLYRATSEWRIAEMHAWRPASTADMATSSIAVSGPRTVRSRGGRRAMRKCALG